MKKTTVLITVILLVQTAIYSQTMDVGVFAGVSYYLGDVNPGVHFQQSKPAAGLIARYNLDNRWSARLSALMGKVSGDFDTISSLSPNPISEIATVMEFNFFPYTTGTFDNFTPYIFCGFSAFMYKIKSDNKVPGQDPKPSTSPKNSYDIAIPFGIGLKYSVNQNISMAFEWGMRKTFSDKIDGIEAGNYPEGTLDWYNFTGVSITVGFEAFTRSTCAEFTRRKRKSY